jgi:hypothetical protein
MTTHRVLRCRRNCAGVLAFLLFATGMSYALDAKPPAKPARWSGSLWGTVQISNSLPKPGETVTVTAVLGDGGPGAPNWCCGWGDWIPSGTGSLTISAPLALVDYSPQDNPGWLGAIPAAQGVDWHAITMEKPPQYYSPEIYCHECGGGATCGSGTVPLGAYPLADFIVGTSFSATFKVPTGAAMGWTKVSATFGGNICALGWSDAAEDYIAVVEKTLAFVGAAQPPTIPADGTSTSSVRLRCFETGSNAGIVGVSVALATNLGTVPPSVTTGTDGYADFTLRAGYNEGTATITASLGSDTATTVVYLGHAQTFLKAAASPKRILADGASTSTITATLSINDQPKNGAQLTFHTDAGGFVSGGAPLDTVTATTNASGIATVTFQSITTEGTANITVDYPSETMTATCVVEMKDYALDLSVDKVLYETVPGAPTGDAAPSLLCNPARPPRVTSYGWTRIPLKIALAGPEVAGKTVQLSSAKLAQYGADHFKMSPTATLDANGEATVNIDFKYLYEVEDVGPLAPYYAKSNKTVSDSPWPPVPNTGIDIPIVAQYETDKGIVEQTISFPIYNNYGAVVAVYETSLPDGPVMHLAEIMDYLPESAKLVIPQLLSRDSFFKGDIQNILDAIASGLAATGHAELQNAISGFTCGEYQGYVLELLDTIRLNATGGAQSDWLLNGFDYGPIICPLSDSLPLCHQATSFWPSNIAPGDAHALILDPWLPQTAHNAEYYYPDWLARFIIAGLGLSALLAGQAHPGSTNAIAMAYYPNLGKPYPTTMVSYGNANVYNPASDTVVLLDCPVHAVINGPPGQQAGFVHNLASTGDPFVGNIPGLIYRVRELADGSAAYYFQLPPAFSGSSEITGYQAGAFNCRIVDPATGLAATYNDIPLANNEAATLPLAANAAKQPPSITFAGKRAPVAPELGQAWKMGPLGEFADKAVPPGTVMQYSVTAERAFSAAQPAQKIVIEDTLDPLVDGATFAFTEAGWADHALTVPDNAQELHLEEAFQSPDGQKASLKLALDATFNAVTGAIVCTFQTLDASTSQPPADPALGFLYPDDITARGACRVGYKVTLKNDAAAGTKFGTSATATMDNTLVLHTAAFLNRVQAAPGVAAPTATNPGPQQNDEGTDVSVPLVFNDPAGRPLTYRCIGLPPGITYADGELTGYLNFKTAGVYSTMIIASNGARSKTISFPWTVGDVNNPPTMEPRTSRLVSLTGESPHPTLINAYDIQGDPITFSAENLPPGLTIDPETSVVAGTITTAGDFQVTLIASDGMDQSTATMEWVVYDKPVMVEVAPQFNRTGDQVNVQIERLDSNPPGIFEYRMGYLYVAGTTINAASGLISGVVPTLSASFIMQVQVEVWLKNPARVAAQQKIPWHVSAVAVGPAGAPVVDPIAPQAVTAGDTLQVTVHAVSPLGRPVTLVKNYHLLPTGAVDPTVVPGASGYFTVTWATKPTDAGKWWLEFTAKDDQSPPLFNTAFIPVIVAPPNTTEGEVEGEGEGEPPAQATVPNVVGLAQTDAVAALETAHLVSGQITTQCSPATAAGLIISQTPPAGNQVNQGTAVALLVSSGPCPLEGEQEGETEGEGEAPAKVHVPNVTGLAQSAVSTALQAVGLTMGQITQKCSATVTAGLVISQQPAANTEVAAGSAVSVVVSTGPCGAEGEGEPEGEANEGESPPTLTQMAQQLYDNFAATDGDGSGGLTLSEAQQRTPSLAADGFATLDKDGNGAVTVAELEAYLGINTGGSCSGCTGGKAAPGWKSLGPRMGDLFLFGIGLLGLAVMGRLHGR